MEAALFEPAPPGPVERQNRVEAPPVAGASPHGCSGGVGDQLEAELLALGGLYGVEVPLSGPADDAVYGAGKVDRLGLGGIARGRVALVHRREVVNQKRQRRRNASRGDHSQLVAARPGRGVDPQPQSQLLSLGGLIRWVAVAGGLQLLDALNGGGYARPIEPDGIGPLEGPAPQGGPQPGPFPAAQRCNREGLGFRCLGRRRDQHGHYDQESNSLAEAVHVSGPDRVQFPDSLCLKQALNCRA